MSHQEENDFKVIVITGASSGIGQALALALAKREGSPYRLVLAARRIEALNEVVEACGGPSIAIGVPTDVTKRGDFKALFEAAVAKFGRVDVLVNNAGRGCSAVPSAMTDEVLDDMMTINVKSAMYGMQEVLPYFAKNEGNKGHIVNVSSVLGRTAVPDASYIDSIGYSASKYYLNALTEGFREEMKLKTAAAEQTRLGRRDNEDGSHQYDAGDCSDMCHQHRKGVIVSLFSPGSVDTGFYKNSGASDVAVEEFQRDPEIQTPEEVADVLINEIIVKKREDVYSRESSYAEWVHTYNCERNR